MKLLDLEKDQVLHLLKNNCIRAKINFREHDVVAQKLSFPVLVKNTFVTGEFRLYTSSRAALILSIVDEQVTSIDISDSCLDVSDSRFSRILNSRITFKI